VAHEPPGRIIYIYEDEDEDQIVVVPSRRTKKPP
jgi:hypothetical protein